MKISKPFAFDKNAELGVSLLGDGFALVTQELVEYADASIWDKNAFVVTCPRGYSSYQVPHYGQGMQQVTTVYLSKYLLDGYMVRVGWADVGEKRYIVSDGEMLKIDPNPKSG